MNKHMFIILIYLKEEIVCHPIFLLAKIFHFVLHLNEDLVFTKGKMFYHKSALSN